MTDKELREAIEQEPTNDFQRAWESVWDTICNHAPKDLFNQITQDGSGIENAVELIKVLSKHYEENVEQASENPFKVGDRVKVIISEGELIDNGCDESVQSGGVYTVQEVEEESIRLGPEDTCSWVAYDDVDIEPAKGQASAIDHINSFTKHHKDIEISFENGKMEVRDWRGKGDPVEYKCDTVEQFEELMGALATTCKYC